MQLGQRIQVSEKCWGTVKYIGSTDFADGEWLGVEVDDFTGGHDGSISAKRYFVCERGHGMFIKSDSLKLKRVIDKLQTKIYQMRKARDEKRSELVVEPETVVPSELLEELQLLREENGQLNDDLVKLKEETSLLHELDDSLQEENARLKADVAELQSTLEELEEVYKQLESELNAEIAFLKENQPVQVEKPVFVESDDIIDLKNQIANLKHAKNALLVRNSVLQCATLSEKLLKLAELVGECDEKRVEIVKSLKLAALKAEFGACVEYDAILKDVENEVLPNVQSLNNVGDPLVTEYQLKKVLMVVDTFETETDLVDQLKSVVGEKLALGITTPFEVPNVEPSRDSLQRAIDVVKTFKDKEEVVEQVVQEPVVVDDDLAEELSLKVRLLESKLQTHTNQQHLINELEQRLAEAQHENQLLQQHEPIIVTVEEERQESDTEITALRKLVTHYSQRTVNIPPFSTQRPRPSERQQKFNLLQHELRKMVNSTEISGSKHYILAMKEQMSIYNGMVKSLT